MTAHTPVPWTANTESDHGDFTIWGPGPCDAFIANVGTAPEETCVVAFDVAKANAEFMVRAVNAHDDLLSALTAAAHALRSYQYGNGARDLAGAVAAAADAAIAKAEARP